MRYVLALAAHRAAKRVKLDWSHRASGQAAVESPILSVSLLMQMKSPLASFNSELQVGLL